RLARGRACHRRRTAHRGRPFQPPQVRALLALARGCGRRSRTARDLRPLRRQSRRQRRTARVRLMGAVVSRSRLAGWLAIAALIIVADQITKVAVDGLFAYGERLPLLPVLDLTLLYNRGAAFSFLAGADGWQRW